MVDALLVSLLDVLPVTVVSVLLASLDIGTLVVSIVVSLLGGLLATEVSVLLSSLGRVVPSGTVVGVTSGAVAPVSRVLLSVLVPVGLVLMVVSIGGISLLVELVSTGHITAAVPKSQPGIQKKK